MSKDGKTTIYYSATEDVFVLRPYLESDEKVLDEFDVYPDKESALRGFIANAEPADSSVGQRGDLLSIGYEIHDVEGVKALLRRGK